MLLKRALLRQRIRLEKNITPRELLYLFVGSVLLAFGLADFLVPHQIAGPGLKGLATITWYGLGIPVGLTIFVLNSVLIPIQAKIIGKKIALKTLIAVIVNSVSIELFMYFVPYHPHNPMLACLYGGIACGIGIGLILKAGGTPGGIDIISHVLHHYYHYPVGDVMLMSNIIISIMAGLVFGPELALYGFLTVFLIGKATDQVLEGMSVNRSVFIISGHANEIGWAIIEELHRGVTCLTGYGVYTSREAEVLLTAVKRSEMTLLREIIYEIDSNAFIIIGEARQVIGRGFVDLKREVKREKDL